MPALRIHHRGRLVWSWRWLGGPVRIGRADDCDVTLPAEAISRTHCRLERADQGWQLTDLSRHGTWVRDRRARTAILQSGESFRLGEYTVLVDDDEELEASITAQQQRPNAELRPARQMLRVLSGPLAGQEFPLRRRGISLGGADADIKVNPALPADAASLHIVRGRAILSRGSRPVYLDGDPVAEPTPLLEGDTLRVGIANVQLVAGERTEQVPPRSFGEMVGEAPSTRRLFSVLERMSRHDAAVLLLGESGTGKELAAQALHTGGARAAGPFVAVNCAAIPHNLVEAQLFGHERGAFTGAEGRRDGAFQRAHGGTLFLDELGEMTLDAQARLLRALESGEVMRVGGTQPEFPDARIVAATNRDLLGLVDEGKFRKDLYYRLSVLVVGIPPLRDRPEDVPVLARSLLQRHHPGAQITDAAVAALVQHHWPGNVRELRNVLTRAIVMGGPLVDLDSLSINPFVDAELVAEPDGNRDVILEALRRCGGNRARAARMLGIPRTSLLYRIMRHNIVLDSVGRPDE